MSDIHTRKEGRAGRITLTRPKALNALTYDMALAVEAAVDAWSDDDDVQLIVIDAEGDRAFCAGGDIAVVYQAGLNKDYDYPSKFWRDEYRMNAKLAEYNKPIVSFMQGFVMGGGVGIGCHVSHRIVGDSTRMAMPECGIGLIPDVGGTHLLAKAPGRVGEYLGLTGDRMDAGDAIFAGFADTYIAEADWDALKTTLIETGDVDAVTYAAHPRPASRLEGWQDMIDGIFDRDTLAEIQEALRLTSHDAAENAKKIFAKNSVISMICTLELVRMARANPDIRSALEQEYRFTSRSLELAEMIEGVRAAIIDKDRNPHWKYPADAEVPEDLIRTLLAPVTGPQIDF